MSIVTTLMIIFTISPITTTIIITSISIVTIIIIVLNPHCTRTMVMPTLQIRALCPDSRAWDKNADFQSKSLCTILKESGLLGEGWVERKGKGRQTRESGEGQGLHTRWQRGTGIVSQSHSEKQERPGRTSPEMSRWKFLWVFRPFTSGSTPPSACLRSAGGCSSPGGEGGAVMGPNTKLRTGCGVRINRQMDLASSLPWL